MNQIAYIRHTDRAFGHQDRRKNLESGKIRVPYFTGARWTWNRLWEGYHSVMMLHGGFHAHDAYTSKADRKSERRRKVSSANLHAKRAKELKGKNPEGYHNNKKMEHKERALLWRDDAIQRPAFTPSWFHRIGIMYNKQMAQHHARAEMLGDR